MPHYLPGEQTIILQTKTLRPTDVIPYENKPLDPMYSLIARPSSRLREEILSAVETLRGLQPEHFYYDPSSYHFTVMGTISINHREEELAIACAAAVRGFSRVCEYRGLQMNNKSIFLAFFFQDDGLRIARRRLREFDPTLPDFSQSLANLDSVGWLNVARLTKPFSSPLRQAVLSSATTLTGTMGQPLFELYKTTSLVLAPEESELVATFAPS